MKKRTRGTKLLLALVTLGGLGYATLLTLFIVPVFYDLLFRKPMKKTRGLPMDKKYGIVYHGIV